MKFLGIIPARYASTRFPGKPLANLAGKPMIERVYRRVEEVLPGRVVVATDDSRIFDAVKAFGGSVVMTSPDHQSGTDRCHEAYQLSGTEADVVINIQGDEPFIAKSQIEAVMQLFDNPSTQIGTLIRPFDSRRPFAELANPNTPKVVISDSGKALYFSRSVIPYCRGKEESEWPSTTQYYTHVGLYAYRTDVLAEIVKLKRSPLEIAESLEQLRWLQAGYHIATATTTEPTIGIDTPADLEAAIRYIANEQ